MSSPDTNGRYFLLPMLDAWTDVFASPGWRTTGTQAQTFLIAPQNWRPDLRERLIEDFKLWRLRHDNVAALRLGGMVRKNDPRKFLARRRPAREAVTKQLIHPNRYTVFSSDNRFQHLDVFDFHRIDREWIVRENGEIRQLALFN